LDAGRWQFWICACACPGQDFIYSIPDPGPPPAAPFAPVDPAERLRTLLKGYPAGTAEAALEFTRERSPEALRRTLAGVLRFHHPPSVGEAPRLEPADAPGDTKLVADLGIDSLTMVEMTFLLQDLWGVTFTDDELRAIMTLDDLNRAILEKASALGTLHARA